MKTAPMYIMKMFNVTDVAASRREPQFFSVPYNRLCNTDKSVIFIGPKLYNKTVNTVNKEIKYITIPVCMTNSLILSTLLSQNIF